MEEKESYEMDMVNKKTKKKAAKRNTFYQTESTGGRGG